MTHDKVRQDFEVKAFITWWQSLWGNEEPDWKYLPAYQAGRAAERAEIREKLESEGTFYHIGIDWGYVPPKQP